MPFSSARPRRSDTVSSTGATSEQGTRSTSTRPASIFEMSSTSSRMASRLRPLRRIVSTIRSLLLRSPRSRRIGKPRIAVIGVAP
jgi:hypothetical protein